MPTMQEVAGEQSFLDGATPPADFYGAAPADGAEVGINPPGFSWVPERGSVAFDLKVSRTADFSGPEVLRFTDLKLNLHALAEPLAQGRWHWRYRCHLQDGHSTPWSITRSFSVSADAPRLPIPPVSEIRAHLAGERPRLYARPHTLPALRQLIQSKPEQWAGLEDVIERKLDHPLMPCPAPYPGGEWNVDIWRGYLGQARSMSSAVDHLSFGYLMTGEKRYGERLREWLCHLSRWDPEGTSSYRYNDEVGMPVLFTLARGYDCGWGLLSDDERELLRTALTRRAGEVYRMFRSKDPYEVRPYDNHATRTINFLGQAALSLLGEVPQAEEWLDYVLKVYVAIYPPWGGDDGGYSQGPSYLTAYLNWMLQFLHLLESATDIDLHQKPFFRNVGYFFLYAVPHHARMIPFGDGMTRTPSRTAQLNMYRLAQKFREPAFQWYAEQIAAPAATVETMPMGLLEFLWHDGTLSAFPPQELPRARAFGSVGEVAIHSQLSEGSDGVYLLFRSSPHGAYSHGYADQNSFYLQGFGQALAICSGYYPWYGSDHHTKWTWQTKAHNSILVNGEGQVTRTRASRGRIDEFFTSDHFDYCRGDATEAYGGRLQRFLRHLLYVREPGGPGWFVIADDLETPEAATFQWLLHALSEMSIDQAGRAVTVSEGEAQLHVSFVAPQALTFQQTDRFDPAPESSNAQQDFPAQWHLTASTTAAQKQGGFLVLLQPQRSKAGSPCPTREAVGRNVTPPPSVPRLTYERVDAPGWLACRVCRQDTETLVGMRVAGAAESGEVLRINEVATDARFFALTRRPTGGQAKVLLVEGSELSAQGTPLVSWDGPRTAVATVDHA